MTKTLLKIFSFILLLSAAITAMLLLNLNKNRENTGATSVQVEESNDTFETAMKAVRNDSFEGSGRVYEAEEGDELSEIISDLKAGDTLLLKTGDYREILDISGLHGTEDNYITLEAAPGAAPVFDGSGLSEASDDPALPDGPVMIRLSDCSYVRLSGISIAHAEGQSACGIYVEPGCDYLIIDNCSMEDITVPDPSVEDHCANGILLFGDSAKEAIEDIFIYKNTIKNCATGWAECISVAGHVTNVTVEGNTIDNTGNIGIDFTGNYSYCPDPSKDFPVSCEAIGNTVKNCKSAYATSYGLYVDGAQEIEFRDNTIIACSGGIEVGAEEPQKSDEYATCKILVAGNKISDCPEAGITIGGYETNLGWVKGVTVRENTCKNSGTDPEGAILTLSKCRGIRIENNIFEAASDKTLFVRSEMGKKWTKDIIFRGNTYKTANSDEYAILW